MGHDVVVALCLVIVIEGLMLFAAPEAWQRMAAQLSQIDPKQLRNFGAGAMVVGLVLLQLAR